MKLDSKHNIFLIGIGGIGMSGLAKYFVKKIKMCLDMTEKYQSYQTI